MSELLGAKFEKQDVELLKRICKARGEDTSSFLRRAVKLEFARLGYLPKDEVKALGVESELPA